MNYIDLRVEGVERVKKFYVPVLNALGFMFNSFTNAPAVVAEA